MSIQEQSIHWMSTTLTELTEMPQQESSTISSQEESFWELTTSTQGESVQDLPPNQQTPKRPSCRVQYRQRWFHSKGAFLVLIWLLLSTTAAWIPYYLLLSILDWATETEQSDLFYLTLLPGYYCRGICSTLRLAS